MINVLMLCWEFPPNIVGGLSVASLDIVSHLSKNKNVNITVVVPTDRSNTFQSLSDKFKIETIDISPDYDDNLQNKTIQYANVVHSRYKNQNIDIVHCHDWLTMRAGILLKENNPKCFFISHIHSITKDRALDLDRNSYIYQIEQTGLNKSDSIIAVSKYNKKQIIETYNIEADKITVSYNIIPIFEKNKTSVKTKNKNVTFVGRLVQQKGCDIFIDIALKMLKKQPDINFDIIGEGNLIETIKTIIIKEKVQNKFNLLGFIQRDNLHNALHQSSLVIMPSLSEPFGLIGLEAIECNTPILSTNNAGILEILPSIINYSYNDSQSFADQSLVFLSNELSRQKYLAKLKNDLNTYKKKQNVDNIINLYTSNLNIGNKKIC